MANGQFGAAVGTEIRNKQTGEITKALDAQEIDGGGRGQFFSGDQFELYTSTPDISNIIGKSPDISQGSDDIRANILSNQNLLNQQLGEITPTTTQDTLDKLQSDFERIKTTTSEELAQIESAGARAGAAYDQYINEAEERRKTTLPSEIIRAGERGGFLSTQQAGIAALLPTEGSKGESFVGQGGALDRTRQTLDRNVSLLKAKQLEAIEQAKNAERIAIQTGKESDFKLAFDIVKFAQQLKQETEDMLIKRQNLGLNIAAEERLQTASTFGIISQIPEGEEVTIGGQTYVGIAIPEAEKAFFTGSNIISLMTSLPAGESQTITDPNTGMTFEITGLAEPDTVQSVDDRGNLSIINKKTGEIINKISGVGKTKSAPVSITIGEQEKKAITTISDEINNLKRPDQNNTIPAAEYVRLGMKFVANNLGSFEDFRKSFPPRILLDKNETGAIDIIQTESQAGAGLGEDEELF